MLCKSLAQNNHFVCSCKIKAVLISSRALSSPSYFTTTIPHGGRNAGSAIPLPLPPTPPGSVGKPELNSMARWQQLEVSVAPSSCPQAPHQLCTQSYHVSPPPPQPPPEAASLFPISVCMQAASQPKTL